MIDEKKEWMSLEATFYCRIPSDYGTETVLRSLKIIKNRRHSDARAADTFDEKCTVDPTAPRSIFLVFGYCVAFVSTLRLGLN
jgi:hypothetical protein